MAPMFSQFSADKVLKKHDIHKRNNKCLSMNRVLLKRDVIRSINIVKCTYNLKVRRRNVIGL